MLSPFGLPDITKMGSVDTRNPAPRPTDSQQEGVSSG